LVSSTNMPTVEVVKQSILSLNSNSLDDTPRCFNGLQRLQTLDGYVIPLSIRSGLPDMDMSPPTAEEIDTYPHVIFNPQVIDDEYSVSDLDISKDTIPFPEYHPDTLNPFEDAHTAFACKLDIFVNLNNVKPKKSSVPMTLIPILHLFLRFESNTRWITLLSLLVWTLACPYANIARVGSLLPISVV
jgi:hypothetical protein